MGKTGTPRAIRMERSQPAIVVAIECVAGEWSGNGDILRTVDVVEEIKIGTSPAIRSPFKGGRSGVRKILHAAFKRGDTSIRVRVRRGREEIKAVITATEVLVPNSKYPIPELERWEASINDYKILLRENPEDEDIATALRDAQAQLKKHRGEGSEVPDYVSDVPSVMTREQFRHIVSSPGLSIALFYSRSSDDSKKMVALMEQLCKHYPTVNFMKNVP